VDVFLGHSVDSVTRKRMVNM